MFKGSIDGKSLALYIKLEAFIFVISKLSCVSDIRQNLFASALNLRWIVIF